MFFSGIRAWALVGCILAIGLAATAPPPARGQEPAPVRAAGSSAPVATDAAGYKVLVPFKRLAESKVEEGKVQNNVRAVLLNNENTLNEKGNVFNSYYLLFVFPMMTQTSEEALQGLPERRNKFFRTEVEICRNSEVHAHLVSLTLDQMSVIVQDTFHPAVRYNAMLIISSLNDQDAVRIGAEKKLPEPMARALPFILEQFRKPENSDAIKVAALIGLARHLEWDPHRPQDSQPIPAALRTQIINELLALAEAKDPPAGRNAEGHLWFRRRAVEALGLACYNKLEPPVKDALDKLLRDDKEPLPLRFAAATAVGRLNYQPPAAFDAKDTAKVLGYLALLACDSELNRVNGLKETDEERALRLSGQGGGSFGGAEAGGYDPMGGAPAAGGSPMPRPGAAPPMPGAAPPMPGGAGGGFGGGFGGGQPQMMAADGKAYRFDLVRRRIRQQLYAVQFGLTGGDEFDPNRKPINGSAPEPTEEKLPPRGASAFAKAGPDKQYVVDVYKHVRKLAEIVELKAVDMPQMEKELRKNMKPLEAITKKLAVPAPPPAAGDIPAVPAPAAAAVAPPAAKAPAPPAAAAAPMPAAPAEAVPAEAAPAAVPAPAPAEAPAVPAAPAPAAAP
jgi:hypothetical protein